MKLRFIYTLFTVAALMTLGSCSFLEEKSWDEVIPKTTNDFAELLVGSAYPYTDAEPFAVTSLMDDDITLVKYASDYDLQQSRANGPTYTWQPFVGLNIDLSGTMYYKYYDLILGCNAVLDNIDEAIGHPEDRDRIKAEALALRAYYYWLLVNIYGEPYNHNPEAPGVPLKLFSEIDNTDMPRNSVEEVYGQIVNDLTEAVRLMEPLPVNRHDSRINLPAIYILFSRVWLHMENWEECVKMADKALATGCVLFDMTTLGTTVTNTTSYYLDYRKNPELEWSFGALPNSLITQGMAYFSPPEELLLTLFSSTHTDEGTGAEQRSDMRFVHGFTIQWDKIALIKKFVTFPTTETEPKQSFRTAEAVLNRAEALAKLGELDDALEDYNTLRRNRILFYENETIAGQEALIEAIRDERRREFMLEGFRWFDLRRYGMPSITHIYATDPGQPIYYVLEEKDPMYTRPLEASLLNTNSKLVQNPSGSMPDRVPVTK